MLPLCGSYLRYYCVCLSLQIIPPRLLYIIFITELDLIIFITELDLINACKCFPVFSSNQQLKYSTQKQKVVELINSDSRDAGLPFHVLCKEESRLVIALDHLTMLITSLLLILISFSIASNKRSDNLSSLHRLRSFVFISLSLEKVLSTVAVVTGRVA